MTRNSRTELPCILDNVRIGPAFDLRVVPPYVGVRFFHVGNEVPEIRLEFIDFAHFSVSQLPAKHLNVLGDASWIR